MFKMQFRKNEIYKNYIIPLSEESFKLNANKKLNYIVQNIIEQEKFKDNEVKKFTVLVNDRAINFILVALPNNFNGNDQLLELGHKAVKFIDKNSLDSIYLSQLEMTNSKNHICTELFIEGMIFGNYSFDKYKSDTETFNKELIITLDDKKSLRNYFNQKKLENLKTVFEAVYFARDLVNMPPNELTPQKFCEIALAEIGNSAKITILDEDKIQKLGMNLLYSVGKGSENKPRFLIIDYIGNSSKSEKYAFVGKGITFDSGGTNLKPTGSIETMKSDMAGAATVLALAKIISKTKLPINVSFYIPLAENTIGTCAYRPGDIIKSFSGKTVEVLNTDAEGRLILADAIAFASKENPLFIIDIATLTGACVVALGSDIAGYFTNDYMLSIRVESSFSSKGENIWRLPLYKNYKERLKSKIADLQNISKKRTEAGAIMGALFLEEFVGNIQWAHIDIAGTAFMEDNHPIYGYGGAGFGVRSLYYLIENIL